MTEICKSCGRKLINYLYLHPNGENIFIDLCCYCDRELIEEYKEDLIDRE